MVLSYNIIVEGFDMTVGFVMIKVHSGGELQAFNKLKKISDVVEVYQIFGEFDRWHGFVLTTHWPEMSVENKI